MPSNPHQEARDCYKYIDKVFKAKTKDGILYKDLIRRCLLDFSISEGVIKNFVDEYYISTGDVKNIDGTLFSEVNKWFLVIGKEPFSLAYSLMRFVI